MRYTYSDFGKFFESINFVERKISCRIITRETTEIIINRTKRYFSVFPNRFFFILLMVISSSLFILFFPKGYEKQIIIAFTISAVILFFYTYILLNKKSKKV